MSVIGQGEAIVFIDEVVALSHVAAQTFESIFKIKRFFFYLLAIGNAGDVFAVRAGAGPFDVAETAVHADQFAGGVGHGSFRSGEVWDAVVRLFGSQRV